MSLTPLNKIIIVGIDGCDPHILEGLLSKNELPFIKNIVDRGSYHHLKTTNPPQSPVAWSSMATGSNPGRHGVFDFIKRNPKNYVPELALTNTITMSLFANRDAVFSRTRKGKAFWETTSELGINSRIIKWPMTFPPEKINGCMLSGLGTPDLRGGLGRYALYTTEPVNREIKGDIHPIPKGVTTIDTNIIGPGKIKAKIRLFLEKSSKTVILKIQDNEVRLKEREWSKLIQAQFSLRLFKKVTGIFNCYLTSFNPLTLYISPINIDPTHPAFPISYPDDYSKDLFNEQGLYHTLGLPEDTNALSDGIYDEDAFLESCDEIMSEREKMLDYELDRFKEGILAVVFDTTDRIQHMFWDREDSQYNTVITDYYKRMDGILGKIMSVIDDKTALFVVSDHGFSSFNREVHLNTWLVKNKLMALKEGNFTGNETLFKTVDWKNTYAYAVGFTSIFLNIKGREARGIVLGENEIQSIQEKIRDSFLRLKDPQTGKQVIKEVYKKEDIFHGPFLDDAPDLVIGCNPGYRTSWQTAIGGVPEKVIEDNTKKWCGDHIIDPSFVPGVFISNLKITKNDVSILDIAPTILQCLNIKPTEPMDGKSLIVYR
ncbi:alkaline phosphatase family protein [Chlamydiota bacterium]